MKTAILQMVIVCVLVAAPPATGSMVYGVGSTGYEGVYVIDTDTGATSLHFSLAFTCYGATDGDDGSSFFATPSGGPLYRIDVDAMSATVIGSFGGVDMKEIAYNESTGVLYGTDYSALYSIDTSTGSATHIGSLGGLSSVWAMDYDASIDELVAISSTDDNMYYIDMATGATTLVGYTGQDRITDIWYDHDTGGMVGVGNGPNQLYVVDSLTGAATVTFAVAEGFMGLGRPASGPPPALKADADEISAWYGGSVTFMLNGGADLAGRNYALFSSVSGTSPGTTLPGGMVLPINWDWCTEMMLALSLSGNPLVVNFIGELDKAGYAEANLTLPGHCQLFNNIQSNYAWCTYMPCDFVSNSVDVLILGAP